MKRQTKEEVIRSLQMFTSRRDDLLHEDGETFEHHLERFVRFADRDPLVQSVFKPIEDSIESDLDGWWEVASDYRATTVPFPDDPDEELILRYRILRQTVQEPRKLYSFGPAHGKQKISEMAEMFRLLVVRPLMEDLSRRLGEAADLASPEAREVQAVPLNRIPGPGETKIFLSHKTVDKPLARRYYEALRALGFDPWLDDPSMPAGANLERELLRGFEQSCAAVFFLTEHFTDEKYLATEVDYAVIQKRQKGDKFAIITLRYPDAKEVPGLLTPYIYKNVENDLDGMYELLRALPIELGPARWKAEVV